MAAYESCYFFGDEFGGKSFEQNFQLRNSSDYNGYVKVNFDTRGFFKNPITDNPSVVSRVANLMFHAANTKTGMNNRLKPFPKIVVVVLEDDLVRCIEGQCCSSIAKLMPRMVNYIMTEHERTVSVFKEYLPAKCIWDCPKILWIHAPSHENFPNNAGRHKFNKCIEECAKFHNNVFTLELKKVWNPRDHELFSAETVRFTNRGYLAYWEAIDKTVRYFDSVTLKKCDKFRKNLNFKDIRSGNSGDRFKWQKAKFNKNPEDYPPEFGQLPAPPPRKDS